MLNIVIPMAGAGSRFSKSGYTDPKPLIKVHGIPMIKVVIDNLRPKCAHRFIFICQKIHVIEYGLNEKFKQWTSEYDVVEIDGLTQGAACTVLAARDFICNDSALMIANSDQFISEDINKYLSALESEALDGLIMTLYSKDPKWSFVTKNGNGYVERVAEKEVISDEATVGVYNFKRGVDFVLAAESMISAGLSVNGEYYVAPVYNLLAGIGKKIGTYNIGSEGSEMHGLGTPVDLENFLANAASEKIKFNSYEDN